MKKSRGLTEASLVFLRELAAHNDRDWFASQKARYERDVLVPARLLVDAICEALAVPFPYITGSSSATGGSLSRLQRDVRFSKDKRPFNTHIAMRFWHCDGRKDEVPGFFLRIDGSEALLGTGLHQPDAEALARVRHAIDRDRQGWRRAVGDAEFERTWGGLQGESLKRVPAPWPADHPFAEDLKRKDFTAFVTLPASQVIKPGFAQTAVARWSGSARLMSFLCQALGLDV